MRGIRTFLIAILITTIGSPWNAQTPNLPALCVEFLYLVVFCRGIVVEDHNLPEKAKMQAAARQMAQKLQGQPQAIENLKSLQGLLEKFTNAARNARTPGEQREVTRKAAQVLMKFDPKNYPSNLRCRAGDAIDCVIEKARAERKKVEAEIASKKKEASSTNTDYDYFQNHQDWYLQNQIINTFCVSPPCYY